MVFARLQKRRSALVKSTLIFKIGADFPALTTTFSLALGNSPVVSKQLPILPILFIQVFELIQIWNFLDTRDMIV